MIGIHIRFEGRLTRDPELKYSNNEGTPFATVGVAVNHRQEPGKEREVTFMDVVLFRQNAEFAEAYARKGNRVYIEGIYKFETYERRDRSQGFSHRVTCQEFILCESAGAKDGDPEAEYVQEETGGSGPNSSGTSEDFGDEIDDLDGDENVELDPAPAPARETARARPPRDNSRDTNRDTQSDTRRAPRSENRPENRPASTPPPSRSRPQGR